MGAGVYGLNDLNHKVSIFIMNHTALVTFYQKLLRNIMHLPKATGIPVLYLLTGKLPLEAVHHKKVLTHFVSMLNRKESVDHEQQTIKRQLAMKDMDSSSWVILVRELLYRYNVASAFLLAENPQEKCMEKDKSGEP